MKLVPSTSLILTTVTVLLAACSEKKGVYLRYHSGDIDSVFFFTGARLELDLESYTDYLGARKVLIDENGAYILADKTGAMKQFKSPSHFVTFMDSADYKMIDKKGTLVNNLKIEFVFSRK